MLGNDILNKLKSEVNPIEKQNYISKMEFDENASKPDLLVFCVPNVYLANYIKTKYTQKIKAIYEGFSQYTQEEVEVKIIVKNNNQSHSNTQEVQKRTVIKTFLNPTYTFETFVIGESNRSAFEIANTICQTQAQAYNPTLIYGGTGLGKTHLLNAIGNEMTKQDKVVIYVTAEEFLNDFLNRINSDRISHTAMDHFREKYRKCDYLLIDDVQFFGGKEKVQEEFFHTFNELHNQQKQIVMTSDKPPAKIKGLENRLRSRFSWGFSTKINSPNLETKIQIIKNKCQLNRYNIDDEVVTAIASKTDDIRQIEGILIQLSVQSSIIHQPITLEMLKHVIDDSIEENEKNTTLETILKVVGQTLNIKPSAIKSKGRTKTIANARRIVIYLARTLTPNSMPILAKELNMKDHSSVSKAYKKIEEEIQNNFHTQAIIEEIKTKIQEHKNET